MAEQEPVEQQEEQREVDYKALYEETLGHSRKWERLAKDNAKAAEQAKAEKQRADALEAEKQRAQWVADASRETGVPADVLAQFSAGSAEELSEKAKGVAGHFKAPQLPVVSGDGRSPEKPPVDERRAFLHQLMGTED